MAARGPRLPEQPPAGQPYVSSTSSDGPPPAPEPGPDPTTAPPPPPMPSFSHSELMNPTPAAAPATPADRPRQVPIAAVAIVGVVVLAIATFLIVQLGESDSGGAADEEALTVEDVGAALDAVTTPPATEQDYVDALLADSPDLGIGASPEQTTCFFRSMVVAVGGDQRCRDDDVGDRVVVHVAGVLGGIARFHHQFGEDVGADHGDAHAEDQQADRSARDRRKRDAGRDPASDHVLAAR